MTTDGARRAPSTRWEYAVSAADQLILWHASRHQPELLQEPLRTRAVVLLAACVNDRAVTQHLDGPDIAAVSLGEVLTALDWYAVSSLESSGAPAGSGGEECAELLQAFGTDKFNAVRAAAREALKGHLADGGPHTRITDRRQALRGITL
ncbi:hypothetical protein ACFVYE_32105 [Streptomyces sp. NPDC058239]|uniref:hypothetical protein n=1 Tax=Streptomyces sp. NPDC058239 TaxID=3346395 RepID=UPI0036EA770E